MPSAWVEHIKEFAKRKGMSYKDALKDPECKSSYHEGKTKGKGMEAPAEKENISMEIAEKKSRGRPKKYATEEERKKAKSSKTIESNKRKKAEKLEGMGMKGKGAGGSGKGKSAGGARATTPPPSAPFTQGAEILSIIRSTRSLQARAISLTPHLSITNLRDRLEAYISTIENPQKTKKLMKTFDKLVIIAHEGDTDIDTDSSGGGAGFDKKMLITRPLIGSNPATWSPSGRKPMPPAVGSGIVAKQLAEDDGGLTHIYPLSRANVIAMIKGAGLYDKNRLLPKPVIMI